MSFKYQFEEPRGFWQSAAPNHGRLKELSGYSEDFVPPAIKNDGALLDGSGAVVAGGAPSLSDDALNGIDWWNGLTKEDRRFWLVLAGSAVPADAWERFKFVRDSLRVGA